MALLTVAPSSARSQQGLLDLLIYHRGLFVSSDCRGVHLSLKKMIDKASIKISDCRFHGYNQAGIDKPVRVDKYKNEEKNDNNKAPPLIVRCAGGLGLCRCRHHPAAS